MGVHPDTPDAWREFAVPPEDHPARAVWMADGCAAFRAIMVECRAKDVPHWRDSIRMALDAMAEDDAIVSVDRYAVDGQGNLILHRVDRRGIAKVLSNFQRGCGEV